MNSEATEQRGEGEELRDEGGEMIITNNEESEQRSEAVQELQDESKEKELNKIVHRDICHHDESKKVELRIYYNNRKVKILFIK